MRRSLYRLALLAGLAFALWAPATGAQTMTFRPVPVDSVVQAGREAAREAREIRRGVRRALQAEAAAGGVQVRVDSSSGAVRVSVGDGGAPEPPPAPEAPETPETPSAVSTTGEIIRFGQDIHVESGQTVQGDVVAMGGDVTIDGTVRGSVTAMGGDVYLQPGAHVAEDVVCLGGTLHEEAGATVGGQRVTAPRSRGAHLMLPFLGAIGATAKIVGLLVGALVLLGLSWLVVKLAPGRTEDALAVIERDGAAAFMVGLLLWALIIPSVILLAIAMALLCITIIGIPLAAAVAVGYVAFFIITAFWGGVVGSSLIGRLVHERFRGPVPSLAVAVIWGVLAVQGLRVGAELFHVIPFFGFLGGLVKAVYFVVSIVLVTLGAGALVLGEYRKRTLQDWWSRVRPSRPARRDDTPPPPPTPPPAPPADPAIIA